MIHNECKKLKWVFTIKKGYELSYLTIRASIGRERKTRIGTGALISFLFMARGISMVETINAQQFSLIPERVEAETYGIPDPFCTSSDNAPAQKQGFGYARLVLPDYTMFAFTGQLGLA